MSEPIFLERVVLSNYRSIKECSVDLGPLTFLVGPNGAGKSNFLDALRLIADSLNTTLEHALRERGGINEVRRRSSGHPTNFGIRLDWRLPNGQTGRFAFKVDAAAEGAFGIAQEECSVFGEGLGEDFYQVRAGQVTASSLPVAPPAARDRLYLVAAGGLPAFRPLYDALSHMGFYNFNPSAIREPQPPDPGEVLKRDGSNLASVLSLMEKENRPAYGRVVEFLSKVVPGIQHVEGKHVGTRETLEFRQRMGSNKSPWRFGAENMSDGTLRAAGVLTALFQRGNGTSHRVPFVGIEEPESALHPGAASVLRDGLSMASRSTQVAVTSHSPDLLDDKEIPDTCILAVVSRNGETSIGPLDEVDRGAIRDRLYTAGELLRLGQLKPDENALHAVSPSQLDLFAEPKA